MTERPSSVDRLQALVVRLQKANREILARVKADDPGRKPRPMRVNAVGPRKPRPSRSPRP